jgi:hypothetical protein
MISDICRLPVPREEWREEGLDDAIYRCIDFNDAW